MRPRHTMHDPFDRSVSRTFNIVGCASLIVTLAFAALLIAVAIALLSWSGVV